MKIIDLMIINFKENIIPINAKEITRKSLNVIEFFYHEIFKGNIRELNVKLNLRV